MALVGRLVADFTSFQDAVQKAQVQLVDFTKGADRVGTSLNRMVDGFSGRKLVQDATLTQRAIAEVGGASKLTDSEMRRVNATMNEAIAKFKALGQTAPAGMQQLADATKGASDKTTLLNLGIGKLAGAFTIAKVAAFGADLIATAGNLQDLHERTGISTDALQDFSLVAEQSGSSIDAIAAAVFQMGKRLSGGDSSATDAVAKLGLGFDELRHMRPEDAFTAIGKALGTLDDPMKRAELGAKVFGRAVDDLVPTFINLNEETKAFIKLTPEQIKRGDQVGDMYAKVKHSIVPVTVATAELAAKTLLGADAWAALILGLGELPKVAGKATEKLKEQTAALTDRALAAPSQLEFELQTHRALRDVSEALAEKTKRTNEAKAATDTAKAANERFRESVINLTSSANGAAAGFGMIGQMMPDLSEQTLLYADRSDRLVSALDETVLSVQDLQRDGRFLSAELIGMDANMGILVPATYGFGDAMKDAADDATGFRKSVEGAFKDLPQLLMSAFTGGGGLGGAMKAFGVKLASDIMDPLLAKLSQASQMAVGVGAGLASAIGAKVGGQGAGVVGGIAGTLGGAAVSAAMGAGMAATLAGTVAIAGATAGIGLAAVGAYYGLKKVFSVSKDEKEARQVWGEFQAQFGTLDDAIAGVGKAYGEMGLLGTEAQRDLAAALDATHVSAKAEAAALAVINDKLAKGAKLAEERGAAEAAAYAEITEAQQAQKDAMQADLDDLVAQRDNLLKSVEKEAPERVMGVIEKGQRAEIANLNKRVEEQKVKMDKAAEEMAKDLQDAFKDFKLKIKVKWDLPPLPGQSTEAPEPDTPGFAGGTHGKYVDFGSAGTLVRLHNRERVMTEAEGQRSSSSNAAVVAMLETTNVLLADMHSRLANSTVVALAKAGIGR